MKKSIIKSIPNVLLLAILCFSFTVVSAVEKPKFSGTWKLKKDECKLSEQFSLAPEKIVITQDDNKMQIVRHVSMQGQEMAIDEKFTLDGKECENSGFQGSKKICIANWSDDSKSLSVTAKMESDYGAFNTVQVYSLDGKKLKVVSTMSSGNGDTEEIWVLEKVD